MIYEEKKKRTVITTNVSPELSQKYKNYYKIWEAIERHKGGLVDTFHGEFLETLLDQWYINAIIMPIKNNMEDMAGVIDE
jgi:hypothetical protein